MRTHPWRGSLRQGPNRRSPRLTQRPLRHRRPARYGPCCTSEVPWTWIYLTRVGGYAAGLTRVRRVGRGALIPVPAFGDRYATTRPAVQPRTPTLLCMGAVGAQ